MSPSPVCQRNTHSNQGLDVIILSNYALKGNFIFTNVLVKEEGDKQFLDSLNNFHC